MKLTLRRLYDNGVSTIGMLFFSDRLARVVYVFTLEDTYRKVKVPKGTRIPAGRYSIKLKKEGRLYEPYKNHKNLIISKFTEEYGIMELQDVPGFAGVLIHIGNDAGDTEGCILVGNSTANNSVEVGYVSDSTGAYARLVRELSEVMKKNKNELTIEVIDDDIRFSQTAA